MHAIWTALFAASAAMPGIAPIAAALPASAIEGRWQAADAIISIAPCTNDRAAYCGTLETLADESFREAAGFVVLRSFTGGPPEWRGQSHDGERGYTATVRVAGDRLTLRSCAAPGLCETETWRRAPLAR